MATCSNPKAALRRSDRGNYALAAARALADYEPDAETLARKAMAIAAEVCVYTNGNLTVETLSA